MMTRKWKEAESIWERGLGAIYSSHSCSNDLFLSISPHLQYFPPTLNSSFSYKPINGSIHWWNQSCHHLIPSPKPCLLILHWEPSLQHMRVWGVIFYPNYYICSLIKLFFFRYWDNVRNISFKITIWYFEMYSESNIINYKYRYYEIWDKLRNIHDKPKDDGVFLWFQLLKKLRQPENITLSEKRKI